MMTTMDAMAKRLAAMDAEADKEEEKVKNEDEESEEDEDKVKSEDSDDEDKDDKKETMDAAAVSALVQKAVATANADLRKDIATKEELVKIASPLIGTFDHSTMSAADVAKYSADKLALTGDPETALRAYAKGLRKSASG
jgi:biotin carboxyl carrier protein